MRFLTILIASGITAATPLVYAAHINPADAVVPVPTTRYDSAFSGYQANQSQEPGAWREHNDAMAAVGGHAGHVKGDAQPAEQKPSAESSMPKGMTDHSKHGK